MGLKVVKGEQKNFTYRLVDENKDPLDLSLYETIQACISDTNQIHKKRLLRTGTTVNTSPIITGIDSSYCEVGDLVAGAGIPSGAKILTVDSATQITLDQNATAGATVPLVIGDGEVVAGVTQIGKFKIVLTEANTTGMTVGALNSEVELVKSGDTKIVLFANTLNVVAPYC